MGLLDGVLGGVIGAGLTSVVSDVIEKHGGVAGLVKQFEQKGLGNVVQSWVGTGANLPIGAEQMHQVLGSDTVNQLAAKFGIDPQELAQKISQLLPQAVDKMTPGGVVPAK